LGEDLLKKLSGKQCFGLYVTHLHDLAWRAKEMGMETLTTQVDPSDGNRRLYRIVRAGPGGYSYAREILARHAMTREQLLERSCRKAGASWRQ
jgi:DNA mismatch repair ATPase MutS